MKLFLAHSPWPSAACVTVCAAFACALILGLLLKTGLAWRLATDIPNDRSLHTRPTPRVGGWGIVPVSTLAILLLAPSIWRIAAGAAFLAAVSQIDDRRGLPARVRFGAHFVVVALLIVDNPAPAPWWALIVVGFLMLWLVNLYNFMDGSDGLAGGMAMFGFTGYTIAALAAPVPQIDLGIASAVVAGAAAGFLLFNFHPARIFLGDAGSIPLGFLAGAFGYWGWLKGAWPIWLPAMVFGPFICDASITLLQRLLRGAKFWEAHREHYYQRMVRLGIGHAATALIWYFGMAMGIMLALWALGLSPLLQWLTVGGWVILLMAAGAIIDWHWQRHRSQSNISENRRGPLK